jgi:glycosyltransferase involved in cell wall biosynthesis
MMNIRVFGTRGFPAIQGGVENHCEHLYRRLALQYQITVYRRKPYVCSDERFDNIRFVDLPSTQIKGFEPFLSSFLAALHILFSDTDIVHIHNIGPAFFTPLLRLAGKYVVLTYHSPNYEHKKWNAFAKLFLKLSEQIALRYAHAVIFVNKFQMDKFMERKDAAKFCFIPNGIEKSSVSKNNNLLKQWDLTDLNYILAVGRITPEKGFDTLINAFLKIDTDYKLVIAGNAESETNYLNQLIALADSERVIFAGFVNGEPLQQLYSHADLFVLSSINEGFPIVLLEAMSYHLPVIVSDIPATRLIDLPADCYFPPTDEMTLSRLLEKKLSTNCSKISYDLKKYNWESIAEETNRVYTKLILCQL